MATMPSESNGTGVPEDRLARLAIQSGKVQPSQAAEARELAAKMRELGVERDLLGALVDKKIITSDFANDLRRQAAAESGPGASPEAPPPIALAPLTPPGPSLEEAEIVFDQQAPQEPRIPSAPMELPRLEKQVHVVQAETAPCANHPDRKAIATCKHCSKPLCGECVVRSERGTFCSNECLTGWRLSSSAKAEARAVAAVRSLWIGKFIVISAILLSLGGIGWFAKHVWDGYRFNSAMGRAENVRATLGQEIHNLRKAVTIKPGNVKARVMLGGALLRASEPVRAIEQLSEALKLDEKNVEALTLLADAHTAQQDYEHAADALERLSKVHSGSFMTYLQLGALYLEKLDDPDKAIKALHMAMESGTESREVRYHLGRALLAKGSVEEARKELARAITPLKSDETSAAREKAFLADRKRMGAVQDALADLARKSGNAEAAIKHLTAALHAAPSSPQIIEKLVRAHLDRGEMREALLVAEKSIQYLAGNSEFVLMLCDSLEGEEYDGSRLKLLRAVHGRVPTTPGLLKKLIVAETRCGNSLAARKLLGQLPASKRADKEFAPAWEAVVKDMLKRRNFEGAEKALKDLGDLTESDPRFAVLWCKTLHLQGRGKEAAEYAKRATLKSPNAPTPHLVLGMVYQSLGMPREAYQSLLRAIELGAGAEAEYQLGMVLWEVGFPEEASKRFVKLKNTRGVPVNLRWRIDRSLMLLSGNVTRRMARQSGGDLDYFVSEMKTASTDESKVLRQIHLATYGMARYASIAAGTALVSPNPEERRRYGKALQSSVLTPGTDYTDLRAELKAAVESFGAAMTAAAPDAKTDVDASRSRYIAASEGKSDLFGLIAAASKTQADMAATALRRHPRKADLAHRLDCVLRRMEARLAVSPGPIQQAVCRDYAVAEMLAALIEVGPRGFTYGPTVDRVLADTATADGAAQDAFAQAGVSRVACLGLLRVLCRQKLDSSEEEGGE